MLFLMALFACDDKPERYFYDISSTVIVTDENGQQINAEQVEVCQFFLSEDYDTRTEWEVHAEQCEVVDIDNGVVMLPNWEGEYFGADVSVHVEIRTAKEVYPAVLLDNDSEVWCDNQVVEDVDEHGNATSYMQLCSENFERYLLWSLILPVDSV